MSSTKIEFIIEGEIPPQIEDRWDKLEDFILAYAVWELNVDFDVCAEIQFSENMPMHEAANLEMFDLEGYLIKVNASQSYENIIRAIINGFVNISYLGKQRLKDTEEGDKYWDGRVYPSGMSEATTPWTVEANLKENELYALWERIYD
mgnify:CR=1 FL=1